MNCKPGDLAVTVPPFTKKGCGRFVRVLRIATESDRCKLVVGKSHGIDWYCEEDIYNDRDGFVRKGIISDVSLRPIRDPGDDAVDETLQRLPAPTRDEVAA